MGCLLADIVVAEGVAIDGLTSRATIFNTLDYVYAPSAPAMFPKFVVVMTYELGETPDVFDERVRLLTPDGAQVSQSLSHIEAAGRVPGGLPVTHRSIHVLWRQTLGMTGDYSVTVERLDPSTNEWRSLGARRLTIVIGEHPLLVPRQSSVPAPPSQGPEST